MHGDWDEARECHYFVDEAGDPQLFGKRGGPSIGQPGCSSYFMLGLLEVEDPTRLACQLTGLRKRLLSDPYFAGVPSMQPERRKTARAFHAKDDVAEARYFVFRLLRNCEVKFYACVRNKLRVLDYVRSRQTQDPAYRYHPNELYDSLVRRLFKERLHKSEAYRIVFASRGKSDRTRALHEALAAARERFAKEHGIDAQASIQVAAATPESAVCLQATDYFLWAVQRLYERGEDRFVRLLWPAFRLVIDIDDKREANYGVYYSQRHPLTADSIAEPPNI